MSRSLTMIGLIFVFAGSACGNRPVIADEADSDYINDIELRIISSTHPSEEQSDYEGRRGYFHHSERREPDSIRVDEGWMKNNQAWVCPKESEYLCILIGGEFTIAIPRAPLDFSMQWRFDNQFYFVMEPIVPEPYRDDLRPFDYLIRAIRPRSWRISCTWIFYSETEGVTGLIDGSCQPLSELKLGDPSILMAPPPGQPPIPLRGADLARVPEEAFLTQEQETYLRTYPMTDEGWRVRSSCLTSELCDVERANRELSNTDKFLNPKNFTGQRVEMCGYIHDRLDDGNIWLHMPRPNLVNSGLGFIAAREREEPSRYDGREACVTGEIVRTGCGKEVDCAWSNYEFALREEAVAR